MKKLLAVLAILSLTGCAYYPVGYYNPMPYTYVAPVQVYTPYYIPYQPYYYYR